MYKGKNVMIVGAGRSGVATARFLASHGAVVLLSDPRSDAIAAARSRLSTLPLRFEEGEPRPETAAAASFVVLASELPAQHPALLAAVKAKREVMSDAELAFRHLKAPLLAVYGSPSSLLTAALSAEMLRRSGAQIFLGGDAPLIEAADKPFNWVVSALTSSQLAWSNALHPRVAGLVSIAAQQHTQEEHTALALRLFARMEPNDIAALNIDLDIRPLLPKIPAGRKLYFSASHPQATIRLDQDALVVIGGAERYPLSEIKLRGKNNHLSSIMAAIIMTRGAGATVEGVKAALASFVGLPHRVEPLRAIDGVSFINDASASSVAETLKTIESFDSRVRLVLLIGGSDMTAPYELLAPAIKARCRAVIVYGEAKNSLTMALQGTTLISPAADLSAAVRLSKILAQPKDAVLFSPASPDYFEGFEARGETFRGMIFAD